MLFVSKKNLLFVYIETQCYVNLNLIVIWTFIVLLLSIKSQSCRMRYYLHSYYQLSLFLHYSHVILTTYITRHS
jgi:hypothetical protein